MNRLLFRLCALPAFLAASSCSLDSFFVHKVLIETPARPEAWSGLRPLTYALIWKDQAGAESRAFVEEGAALVVDVARGRPQGILAFPSCGKRAFRPAGALSNPFDVKASKSGLPSSEADSSAFEFPIGLRGIGRRLHRGSRVRSLDLPDRKVKIRPGSKRARSLDGPAVEGLRGLSSTGHSGSVFSPRQSLLPICRTIQSGGLKAPLASSIGWKADRGYGFPTEYTSSTASATSWSSRSKMEKARYRE